MTSKKNLVLQSFYPNKIALLASSVTCTSFSAVIFHLIHNPGSFSGSYRAEIWNYLPIEIQYLIFLFLNICTIVLLVPLFPNSVYVKVTKRGIVYKSLFTLFKESNISWEKIDDFYINSSPSNESIKFVKIRFKETYSPNYAEKELVIFGNPNKVLNIVKNYLRQYSEKPFN